MTAIITQKFRQHNATQFLESFSETAGNTYYVMFGKAMPFTAATTGGDDTNVPSPVDDVSSEYETWDAMIAGKKLPATDISYSIPRRDWTNSTTYDMYEHNISTLNVTTSGASNIWNSTFYFKTSDNRVYKVLDNNGGVAYSGAEPTSESTSSFSIGGYVLKYMYTISASQQSKFVTTDFMPVSTDSTVSAAAVDGKIESLIITSGSGYTNGTYYAAVYGDGTNAGTSSGAVVRITVTGNVIQSFGLTAGSNTSIHTGGVGYTYGSVNLSTGYTFSDAALTSASAMGGVGGNVQVIISPNGGHGSSGIDELGGNYIVMNAQFIGAERDDLLTGNDFREISIISDPTTYGTSTIASDDTVRQTGAMKLASASTAFQNDEEITQASTGAVGRVTNFDATNNIVYYNQERYAGYGTDSTTGAFKAFTGANAITGSSSSATGTPDATADSSITLINGFTITFSDGYANPELQPDSGMIIYNETRKPIVRATDQTEDIKIIVEF
jgi:hypothetical protein